MRIIDIHKNLDTQLLLEKALNQPREFFYKNPRYKLSQQEQEAFQKLNKRRQQGEPIAYILGKKEFWSQELAVNNKVLIPRPETELLIEIILDKLKKKKADVADLGTGSGAIACALAKERPSWNVVATDISTDALQVASFNAMQSKIQNIEFYCGNWCQALPNREFDAIISNPPYIKENDPHLMRGDVVFEPEIALKAGDGLQAIKSIISQAKNKLKTGGILILEHGYDQKEKVRKLLHNNNYKNIISYKDLAGIDRAILAVNKNV